MLGVLLIIFKWVLNASLIASFIVGILLVLKKCVGSKLNVNWHYSLWIIVIVKLVVPLNFSSDISIFNYLKLGSFQIVNEQTIEKPTIVVQNNSNKIDTNDTNHINEEKKQNAGILSNTRGLALSNNGTKGEEHSSAINIFEVMAVIWIAIAMILLLYMIFLQYSFDKKIKKGIPIKCKLFNDILSSCMKDMAISKNIVLVRTKYVKSPALYGVIHTKILLPESIDKSFTLDDLRSVFFHELSHFKRKDVIMNYICNVVQIVYWFNPIIWYAFYKMKNDREAACDNMALSFLGEETKVEYGKTILKLVRSRTEINVIPGVAGIQTGKHTVKERVRWIKMFQKSKSRMSIIGIFTLILAALFLLTTAANNVIAVNADKDKTYQEPKWIEPLKGDYSHVFSDKTKVKIKRVFVIGKGFLFQFTEELNGSKDKEFRIYSHIKNKNSKVIPNMSWSDPSKVKVIHWYKIFPVPKSFDKNYTLVLTKKIDNKNEKCEIKIPLYKKNINQFQKGIKLNKIIKNDNFTVNFDNISVSPNITTIKSTFKANKKLNLIMNGSTVSDINLDYSFYADGKKYPGSYIDLRWGVNNSMPGYYYVPKPHNIKIKDIKVIGKTYKYKNINVPIQCENKVISIDKDTKILIKRSYKIGKNAYFEVECNKKYEIAMIPKVKSTGYFIDKLKCKNTKDLKNGNKLITFIADKYAEKSYFPMEIDVIGQQTLAAFPDEISVAVK